MLDDRSLDVLFRNARAHNGWQKKPVTDDQLRAIYELMKWGPTSANCSPARIVFVRTPEGKERLRPALSSGNTDKTMAAPVTAIVAYDTRFYELLPRLYHNPDAINWYNKPSIAEVNGFRNGSLQGGYLILALRAVGLDCGAMSGFDNAKVDAAFFPDGRLKSNFLINIGYGTGKGIPARNPRLDFEEQCRLL